MTDHDQIRTFDDIPTPCALEFQALKVRMDARDERTQKDLDEVRETLKDFKDTADAMRLLVIGDGNGHRSIGEQFRTLTHFSKDHGERLAQLEQIERERAWGVWKKVAAVCTFIMLIGTFVMTIVRTFR